jgi:hypothetical protein
MKSSAWFEWMAAAGLVACLAGCVDPKAGGPKDTAVDEIPPDADPVVMVDADALDADPVDRPGSPEDRAVSPDAPLFLDAAIDLPPAGRLAGLPCGLGTQCLSGFCADGLCCASECKGLCVACSASRTKREDGVCAPVAAGSDPDNECAEDVAGGCGSDGTCDGAGACRNRMGTSCGAIRCETGKFTPAPTCDGKGSCLSATATSCGSYGCSASGCRSTCSADGDCAPGIACVDAKCGGKRPNGAACAQPAECGSNLCVDGVCCDQPCSGTCEACAGKKTGGSDGVCAPIKDGDDPDGECNPDGTPCGTDGACNGARACRRAPAGKSCGTACSGNALVTSSCDGNGACAGSTTTSGCGLFSCSGSACLNTCSGPSQCVSTAYCSGTSCAQKKGLGSTCSGTTECASGYCVDGVCCGDACSGTCTACNVGGHAGTCWPVGAGTADPACPNQGSSSCGTDGTCDGSGGCRKYPGGTTCAAAICSNGQRVPAATCNGTGTCVTPGAVGCSPWACSGGACVTSCNGNTDCASPNVCNTSSHVCGPAPVYHWSTSGQILGTNGNDGPNPPPSTCSTNGASYYQFKAASPNGAQWGHSHIAAKDSLCPAGQWRYIDAVRDCSGSPVVMETPTSGGEGELCQDQSKGEIEWYGVCSVSLKVIAQLYYCQ